MKVLVTGASSGLGAAICKEFQNKSSYLDSLEIYKVAKEKTDANTIVCDIRDEPQVVKLGNSISELDILINCAGINKISPIEDLTVNDWWEINATNAASIFLMVKQFLPQLTKSKGTILNVISNACRIPMTHSLAYNASKAAAEMMTRQMARELTKSKGITILGINPNKLEGTGMSKYIEETVPKMRGWTKEEAKKYQLDALPAGIETKPEWIAELVVWLLIEKRRHQYLTGCILDLGGP